MLEGPWARPSRPTQVVPARDRQRGSSNCDVVTVALLKGHLRNRYQSDEQGDHRIGSTARCHPIRAEFNSGTAKYANGNGDAVLIDRSPSSPTMVCRPGSTARRSQGLRRFVIFGQFTVPYPPLCDSTKRASVAAGPRSVLRGRRMVLASMLSYSRCCCRSSGGSDSR